MSKLRFFGAGFGLVRLSLPLGLTEHLESQGGLGRCVEIEQVKRMVLVFVKLI